MRVAACGEEMDWVRPSLILALGALGALSALAEVTARTDEDREALRRARGKAGVEIPPLAWSASPGNTCFLRVPQGLEGVAAEECRQHGLTAFTDVPGLLRLEMAPTAVPLSDLRCIHDLLVPLAESPRPDPRPVGQWKEGVLAALVRDLLHKAKALQCWREWLATPAPTLSFRLFLDLGKASREDMRHAATVARDVTKPWACEDNPSAYGVELGLVARRRQVMMVLKPSFMGDRRFSYRRRDVGASINPVVAACLARLLGPARGGLVLDPTCGSATLLIERSLLDPAARLRGIDISPTAIQAAQANVEAAGLTGRTVLVRGDAGTPLQWKPAELILANLPFGLRVHSEKKETAHLYEEVTTHVSRFLRPGGTALLYTASGRDLDAALAKNWHGETPKRLRVQSGGLSVEIRVLSGSKT